MLAVNTSKTAGAYNISYDEQQGMLLAIEKLQAVGREKIYYLCGPDTGHYSWAARRQACEGAGATVTIIELSGNTYSDSGRAALWDDMVNLFVSDLDYDAIILSSSLYAPMFYQVMAQVGKRMGEDLSVIGFSHFGAGALLQPALCVMDIDHAELADLAFNRILSLIRGKTMDVPVCLSYSLKDGASV